MRQRLLLEIPLDGQQPLTRTRKYTAFKYLKKSYADMVIVDLTFCYEMH